MDYLLTFSKSDGLSFQYSCNLYSEAEVAPNAKISILFILFPVTSACLWKTEVNNLIDKDSESKDYPMSDTRIMDALFQNLAKIQASQ